jgi:hypothetical protein
MKFIFKFFLITLLCFLLQNIFPWWISVIIAFIVNMIFESKTKSAFLTGFLGVGLLWGAMAWNIDYDTHSILSDKIAQLFTVNSPLYIIIITALIGALSGGLGALCGITFRKLFQSNIEKNSLNW